MTVVFPFENMGSPEDAYFAAGMSEEITSRLAAVSGLGVISRTSATQYDRSGKTMKQIGQDLGVDYVLEGSVRWAKSSTGPDRVRITPQLIRVADDTHMWSETYDREIDDIFEVQTDIAKRVIDQLDVALLGSERKLVEDRPTDNVEAYELYLKAKDFDADQFAEYDEGVVGLLEKAVGLDPNFLAAWSELSHHHSGLYPIADQTEERLSKARRALQAAEAIDRDHHLTRLARGYYYYYGFRDYDRALEDFLAAAEAVPNDSEVREATGYIYRRQGKWNESNEALKSAMELDPQEWSIPANLAATLRGMREFAECIRYSEIAMKLEPDNYGSRAGKAQTLIHWKGDFDGAREVLRVEPTRNPFPYHFAWYSIHLWNRDYKRALEQARKIDDPVPIVGGFKAFSIALAECMDKGPREAKGSLDSAAKTLEELLEFAPSNFVLHNMLAGTYAMMGRDDEAVREAKLGVDLSAKDKFAGPGSLESLASVYATIGRHDEAIDLLERLLNTVYEEAITPQMLKLDPTWDPLREHPRFQQLMKENT